VTENANAPGGNRGAAVSCFGNDSTAENTILSGNGQVDALSTLLCVKDDADVRVGDASCCESGTERAPCCECGDAVLCLNCDGTDICANCAAGGEDSGCAAGGEDSVSAHCASCGEADCICAFSPWSGALAFAHPSYKMYVRALRAKARSRS
jgi:hypothetical protein